MTATEKFLRVSLEVVCPENRFFYFSKSVCGQFNKSDDETDLVLNWTANFSLFLVLSATETN